VYGRYEVETCFDLIARGALKPQVAATFPLEEARKAMDLMESREFFGKIVLTAGGGS
jgi:NADPH:quinone reductase-like Zn-dependent oxidoreductase